MSNQDNRIFCELFNEACARCFGHLPAASLSEAESRLLSNKILEQTGLVIGVKSIRNYSLHVFGGQDSKDENPSIATLDTLARYVANAPYTDELKRKASEGHHPYWFEYRNKHVKKIPGEKAGNKKLLLTAALFILLALLTVLVLRMTKESPADEVFTDPFNSTGADSLSSRGWSVKSPDSTWALRNAEAGYLRLYTMIGDNWPSTENPARIRNLLLRKIPESCFSAELQLRRFVPQKNWQQAGILLLEDSTFGGKAIRLSLAYNDFFGGYQSPPEVIIQAVSSAQSGNLSKPEEIAHVALFKLEPDKEKLVAENLSHTSLKIEKKGNQFHFLYSAGPQETFAYKEIITREFDFIPRYVGIFAIQGHAKEPAPMPVDMDLFSIAPLDCNLRQ